MKTMTHQALRRRRGRAVRRIRRTAPLGAQATEVRFELMTISLTYVFTQFAVLDALIAAGPNIPRRQIIHNGRKPR